MLMLKAAGVGAAFVVVVVVTTMNAVVDSSLSFGVSLLMMMLIPIGTMFVGGGLAGYVHGRGAAALGTYGGGAVAGLLAGAVPAALHFGWIVAFGDGSGGGSLFLHLVQIWTGALFCTTIGGVIGHAISRKVLRSRSS